MTTYTVDEECNAEFFWSCIRRDAPYCPIPRFGEWLLTGSGSITLDEDESAVVASWLVEQPGWTDPEYPEHAPHPLVRA